MQKELGKIIEYTLPLFIPVGSSDIHFQSRSAHVQGSQPSSTVRCLSMRVSKCRFSSNVFPLTTLLSGQLCTDLEVGYK